MIFFDEDRGLPDTTSTKIHTALEYPRYVSSRCSNIGYARHSESFFNGDSILDQRLSLDMMWAVRAEIHGDIG